MVVDVVRSASQASNLGRVCTSRKNADVTSSTENELANCSALEAQAADQNNATAARTTTLPMTVGDRERSGSETTVTATVELSPGPPAVNPSPPRERLVSDNVSHLPLSGSVRRSSIVYIFLFILYLFLLLSVRSSHSEKTFSCERIVSSTSSSPSSLSSFSSFLILSISLFVFS